MDAAERVRRNERVRQALEHYERVATIASERDALIPIALQLWVGHGLERFEPPVDPVGWRQALEAVVVVVLPSMMVGALGAIGVMKWLR